LTNPPLCDIIPIEREVKNMYRVYAHSIATGKVKNTVCGIAGLNALERSPLWKIIAIEHLTN
jgi:hypothetical protein